MAKATSGWYPEVDVARQALTTADECTTMQVGPIACAHLRACALLSSTGQCWTVALLQRWHTDDLLCWQVAFLQCWHDSSTQRWHAVDHAVLSIDQASCRVARALGDDACDSGQDGTNLEVAGLKGFADGTVPIPLVDDVGLRGEFCAAHLLTFMVISRCCSPVVQLALRSCREQLDAGHQAWHFILSTYQVRDNLYIAQLEEKMTHIRMGEQESATDYCNRARRILAEMRMAGAEYSMASYISYIVKGLPRGYNLMKRMMMVPEMRESLDEDSITSYILQDEEMQEAEQPRELFPQVNYAAPTKLNQQQGQRRKPSGGGRSTVDVNEKRSARDKGRGGGGRRRECWICHDPDHLSYECPDRDDSDEDNTKGGRGRSTSRCPRRDARPRK
ncbi:unnamed protein product [Closterium sp. NIES-53]